MLSLVTNSTDTNECVRLTLGELREYIEGCVAKDSPIETATLMTILFRVPSAGQFIMDNHIGINVAGHLIRFNEKALVEDIT
jgi:hypothetical protein